MAKTSAAKRFDRSVIRLAKAKAKLISMTSIKAVVELFGLPAPPSPPMPGNTTEKNFDHERHKKVRQNLILGLDVSEPTEGFRMIIPESSTKCTRVVLEALPVHIAFAASEVVIPTVAVEDKSKLCDATSCEAPIEAVPNSQSDSSYSSSSEGDEDDE